MNFATEALGLMLILLLFVTGYWSLVVLPKQRAFRKHQQHIRQLRVGSEIITYGGLIGTITSLAPDKGEATLRLAENVEVRIITAALTQMYNPDELAQNAQIGTSREQHHEV